MNKAPEEFDQCRECGLCSRECELLREIGETSKQLARRGIVVTEAFSCSLCGLCESVCITL